MKQGCLKFVFMGLLLAIVIFQFTGCAATPQARIQQNPQLFESLSAADRELVQKSTIREGMTMDAVFLAWGRPDIVTRGVDRGRPAETWRYTTLEPVYWYGGPAFGPGYWGYYGPHYYPWAGTMPHSVPVPTAAVRFRNGRVTSWELAGR
jgi:hypothetical protein